ncbi:dopamine receptor 2-like [Mya arenaria]|uniref:dopamine receptor 2-like n=1 Tax=Mya arenaria TaxID=6604 RepID=UPI0022E33C62|nr:dopamine receptor 2-like [Mya arenaria]
MFANTTDTVDDMYASTKHPVIAVVLGMCSFITVLGNVLVIAAVVKGLNLRTVTNYMIVSLAFADVMVGGIVMPFSISFEINNHVWYYGPTWCDLWHSFDVLGSTASILNLCTISLDRYWAITDPIAYPNRMTPCRVSILITCVWLCSAGISFPAIAWWKAVSPPRLPNDQCVFTEDGVYLIFSSMVSFYCPTIIMIFVYIQIYRAARNQRKSIESGAKVLKSHRLFGTSGVMTLRIHRGGTAKLRSPGTTHESTPFQKQSESEEEDTSRASYAQTPVHSEYHGITNNDHHNKFHSHHHDHHHNQDQDSYNKRPMKSIAKRLSKLALSKKMSKLAKEQKAAKTLGIVVGVFILCWMPFFVVNVLIGICGAGCISHPDIVMPVFTWFGYINSGVNPIIYALSMRDFRRAFGRIIFCCCPKYRLQYRHRGITCRNTSSSSFMGSTLL